MDRLTFVDEEGLVLFDNPAGFPEDIGFTIRELAENEEWEALDNIAQRLANCEQRLKHYEDLEKQGKLLKLPCAVGDTVYRINTGKKEPIISMLVIGVAIRNENKLVIQTEDIEDDGHNLYSNNSIGKTVFLTREEAEAALKELEGKEG